MTGRADPSRLHPFWRSADHAITYAEHHHNVLIAIAITFPALLVTWTFNRWQRFSKQVELISALRSSLGSSVSAELQISFNMICSLGHRTLVAAAVSALPGEARSRLCLSAALNAAENGAVSVINRIASVAWRDLTRYKNVIDADVEDLLCVLLYRLPGLWTMAHIRLVRLFLSKGYNPLREARPVSGVVIKGKTYSRSTAFEIVLARGDIFSVIFTTLSMRPADIPDSIFVEKIWEVIKPPTNIERYIVGRYMLAKLRDVNVLTPQGLSLLELYSRWRNKKWLDERIEKHLRRRGGRAILGDRQERYSALASIFTSDE